MPYEHGPSPSNETPEFVMQMSRVLGAVLLAIGVVFLVFAYRASNAPLEQISDTLTGHYSNETMWYFVFGVGGAVGGLLLLCVGLSRKGNR
jgi:drug/metabolite transporter (DMT)-like permease